MPHRVRRAPCLSCESEFRDVALRLQVASVPPFGGWAPVFTRTADRRSPGHSKRVTSRHVRHVFVTRGEVKAPRREGVRRAPASAGALRPLSSVRGAAALPADGARPAVFEVATFLQTIAGPVASNEIPVLPCHGWGTARVRVASRFPGTTYAHDADGRP